MASQAAEFDAVAYAQRELVPLLKQITAATAAEGQTDQTFYFQNLLEGIGQATHEGDLIEVFFNLSAANFMGFDYAMPVVVLLDQLLEKAELLSESQAVPLAEKH